MGSDEDAEAAVFEQAASSGATGDPGTIIAMTWTFVGVVFLAFYTFVGFVVVVCCFRITMRAFSLRQQYVRTTTPLCHECSRDGSYCQSEIIKRENSYSEMPMTY